MISSVTFVVWASAPTCFAAVARFLASSNKSTTEPKSTTGLATSARIRLRLAITALTTGGGDATTADGGNSDGVPPRARAGSDSACAATVGGPRSGAEGDTGTFAGPGSFSLSFRFWPSRRGLRPTADGRQAAAPRPGDRLDRPETLAANRKSAPQCPVPIPAGR